MPVFEAFRLALQTIRAQKLKSGFSLLGVFIGVASLIAAWSIVNGVNRYMTEKFAQTLYGVNTFQLRRRPMFAANVPDSVWRAWRRRPRIKFSDAEAVTAALTMPVVTAWQSDDNGSVFYGGKEAREDRKSTRLNSSHITISYAVFCLKKKKYTNNKHLIRGAKSHQSSDQNPRLRLSSRERAMPAHPVRRTPAKAAR